MIKITLFFLVIAVGYLFFKLSKETKRNRILQSFIAGMFDSIHKNIYSIERIGKKEDTFDKEYFKDCRNILLDNVAANFEADFWATPYEKWIKKDRNLFYDNKYANDGFNMLYLDFFDKKLKEWYSDDLMSPELETYLRDDVEVTVENIGELDGEIAMFTDLLEGKLNSNSFTEENIEEKLSAMFGNIKEEKLNELKEKLIKQKQTGNSGT